MDREAEGSILGLRRDMYRGEEDRRQREGDRREGNGNGNGHGSVRIRTSVLLSLLAAAASGGTVWVKAKEPDTDLAMRVTVIETQRALEKDYLEKRLKSMEDKLDLLVGAMPPQDREQARRRR